MAKPKGLNLELNDVSQTINLEEITGVSLRGERSLRLAIAQAVIDHIVERTTEKNVGVDGKPFRQYSDEYQESAAYQTLKDSDDVNLELTGRMLGSIDVLKDGPNTVVIGFPKGVETAKAYNHNVGDTVPKRAFFGVTQSEIKEIIQNEFAQEIAELKGGAQQRTAADIFRETGRLLAIDALGRSNQGDTVFFFSTIEDILGDG